MNVLINSTIEVVALTFSPFGILALITILILMALKVHPTIIMWLMIGFTFIHIVILNIINPYPINFFALFLPVLLSSFYYNIRLLWVTGLFTCLSVVVFFQRNILEIQENLYTYDVIYLVLLVLLVTVILAFHAKTTKQWILKAETNERKMEAQLFSSQSYFNLVFEHAEDAIAVYNLHGKIIDVNPSFEQLYLWGRDDIIGKSIAIIPNHLKKEATKRLNLVKSGQIVPAFETFDQNAKGELIQVEVSLTPLFDKFGNVVATASFSKDVSYKKETERLLIQSEKLNLAGEMAAGVAHEIRNPLTVLSGFVQMMNEDKDNPYKHFTKIMDSELHRINLIIGEFLVLAKPQARNFQSCRLDHIIQEVVLLYESEFHLKNVEISTIYNKTPHMLMGDPNLLKQLFINLFKNSIEAMENGGNLTISSTADLSALSVTITDTGHGISEELLKKIKKPFFTTKEKGTGLGLMISEKIIQEHGGHLNIKSTESIGTTITIIFPVGRVD